MALTGNVKDIENIQNEVEVDTQSQDKETKDKEDTSNNEDNDNENDKPSFIINIDKINTLLTLKPELAEYLYLELCKEGL